VSPSAIQFSRARAISKGIGRQSRKILDNIGVIFKREQAYKFYKEMYGLTKLTETEKSEAWKQFAIEQVIKKAELLGAPTNSELERSRMECTQQNAKNHFGKKLRE